jgi:uncharacterized protein YbjQ (UPF0145 family)
MPEFEKLPTASRNTAMHRMIEHARQLGANAIIGFRFDASEFSGQFTEIVAVRHGGGRGRPRRVTV